MNEEKKEPIRKFTTEEKIKVASRQRWKCSGCEKGLVDNFHIYYLDKNPRGWLGKYINVVAMCNNCYTYKVKEDEFNRKQVEPQKKPVQRKPFNIREWE